MRDYNKVVHLLGDSFQSLAAGLKQNSGRAGVLADRLASKHHAGTGQTGSVEDLHTRVKNEMYKQIKANKSTNRMHISPKRNMHLKENVYRAKLVLVQGVE